MIRYVKNKAMGNALRLTTIQTLEEKIKQIFVFKIM